MTLQEEQDLKVLKEKIAELKVKAFDAMTYYTTGLSESSLKCTGTSYGNELWTRNKLGDALIYTHKSYKKNIEKLTTEYIRKYPD